MKKVKKLKMIMKVFVHIQINMIKVLLSLMNNGKIWTEKNFLNRCQKKKNNSIKNPLKILKILKIINLILLI